VAVGPTRPRQICQLTWRDWAKFRRIMIIQQILTSELKVLWEARSTPTLAVCCFSWGICYDFYRVKTAEGGLKCTERAQLSFLPRYFSDSQLSKQQLDTIIAIIKPLRSTFTSAVVVRAQRVLKFSIFTSGVQLVTRGALTSLSWGILRSSDSQMAGSPLLIFRNIAMIWIKKWRFDLLWFHEFF
jgi:hypothetical protein